MQNAFVSVFRAGEGWTEEPSVCKTKAAHNWTHTHTQLYIWILLNFSATQWPNEILFNSASTLNTYNNQICTLIPSSAPKQVEIFSCYHIKKVFLSILKLNKTTTWHISCLTKHTLLCKFLEFSLKLHENKKILPFNTSS